MATKSIKNNTGLSEEFINNIENYSNDIITITEFVDAVRKRPGMYIGPLGGSGFLNMIREVFQNALDQMVSASSPCDLVKILIDIKHETVIISDNGMGIPFDDMIRVYTTAHTSKNYVKKKGDYSAGLNGIGAKATNALSERFMVTSYKYTGEAKQAIFEKGKVIEEKMVPNEECRQGTEVMFRPDHGIMGNTQLDSSIIYLLIRDMLSLTAIGNKVDYTVISESGKTHNQLLVNEDGILTNLIAKCESMVVNPIIVSADTGDMKIDAAFTFDSKNLDGENITAFANMCPTSTENKNTHVTGFLDGVCSWFVKHMNNNYLGEKSKVKAKTVDILAGLSAMISAFHLEPEFTGQAKEVFSNDDFKLFAKQTTMVALDNWSKDRPNDLQKVCKLLKEVAEIRMKSENDKVKLTAKYNRGVTSGLPIKYKRPTGPASKGWELIIVEGDSAESSASAGRDEERQGIFPIRGKILNVYDAAPDQIALNVEIQGIKDILGAGIGKNFDISKVKFKKIIFMTDADADGAHISSLLLLVFLKLFPGLVESGMVYKAVPPLYGIKKGKNKYEYFTERIDYAKYMQKYFFTNHKVADEDGRVISSINFTTLLMENEDYVYHIEALRDRYGIDPELLELILISYIKKDSFATLRKKLTSTYRFLNNDNIVQSGNTIKIKGLVNSEIQTIFYNERFIGDCKDVMPYIENIIVSGKSHYLLDDKRVCVYELIKSVESSTSSNVTRYKGLGEMDGPQLAESALHPDSNRMLVRYTTDNIKEDIMIIRSYQSDKKRILENVGTVTRTDLIG